MLVIIIFRLQKYKKCWIVKALFYKIELSFAFISMKLE